MLEDVIGQIVDDGAGGTIFTFISDVENLTGGLGDDTLIGSAGNNVLDGGAGITSSTAAVAATRWSSTATLPTS